MTTNLSPSLERYLTSLNAIGDRMQNAQREITSGKRVNTVSDSPDQVSTLLQTRASLATAAQIQSNLGRFKLETDAGEQALQAATQLMDRVQSLGTQAATSTQTPDGFAAIGQELGSILEQMGGLAATSVGGRYIFSGDRDGTKPYSIDLTQANPVSLYFGSAATRVAQHPNGNTFSVSQTAQQIFDGGGTSNVFQSIVALRDAALANDSTAAATAVGNLAFAASHLNDSLAYYGSVQNQIADTHYRLPVVDSFSMFRALRA
mgnify:FL=1